MGRKEGRDEPLSEEGAGPHLTQCGLRRGLPRTKWHLDPCSRLTTIRGPKLGVLRLGVLCPPLLSWGAGTPSNTMSPGPRSTSVPSGILIHPAVWPQQIREKNWGCAALGERELGLHLTQCGRGHAKFHFYPPNRLATIHQCHRQDRQTDRTDRQTGQTDNGLIA